MGSQSRNEMLKEAYKKRNRMEMEYIEKIDLKPKTDPNLMTQRNGAKGLQKA